MQIQALEVFRDAPFLFWIKDQKGRYVWCNQTLKDLAGQDVLGKTDRDLPWSDRAEAFMEADQRVFETGQPYRLHEQSDAMFHGQQLCVCKWLENFEGQELCFGISFAVEHEVPYRATKKESMKEQSMHYAGH